MLDWTDRHCRFFLRQITRHTLLYTEMVTTGALLHQPPGRFLDFDPAEHPLALQLGGSDPRELGACARLAERWGYDEINLNVGCPSDRVQNGRFGACLMAEPLIVADAVRALRDACDRPVTVKHRIGIDDRDSHEQLVDFVGTVAEAGCTTFIVHARKAWLKGLSPKENREVPPLDYGRVHRLKREFPGLEIVINGGFRSVDDAIGQLEHVDGVMIGREAYTNPWMLADADTRVFGRHTGAATPLDVVQRMLPYVELQLASGIPLHRMTRHLLGLFQGRPGARAWRRHLSQHAHTDGAGIDVVRQALKHLH
jgi:tRNA-dihydrouridine synthase A